MLFNWALHSEMGVLHMILKRGVSRQLFHWVLLVVTLPPVAPSRQRCLEGPNPSPKPKPNPKMQLILNMKPHPCLGGEPGKHAALKSP